MNKQQVWQKMHKSLVHSNCRCMKNKWVFKIKHNGVCWESLVACGYSQVPGVDFLENYSLVVNGITFQILLLIMIHFGYLAKKVDVKMAFLYSDIEKKNYRECSNVWKMWERTIALF